MYGENIIEKLKIKNHFIYMEAIILYPVTIKIGDDSSSYKSSIERIITKHSNSE